MQTLQKPHVASKGGIAMVKRTLLITAGVIAAICMEFSARAIIFINRTVHETLPSAVAQQTAITASVILAQGRFHGVSHESKGLAVIWQLPDGKRVLRFTEFETSNGPDVPVYLVAATDANDNEIVTKAGFITLGGPRATLGIRITPCQLIQSEQIPGVTVWAAVLV